METKSLNLQIYQKLSIYLTAEPAGHNLGPHRPAVGLVLAETGAGTASEMNKNADYEQRQVVEGTNILWYCSLILAMLDDWNTSCAVPI